MVLSRRTGWIGVDVGTRTVKLAQLVRTAEGVQLHRAAVIQRPVAWPEDDAIGTGGPTSSLAEISAARDGFSFIGRNAACVVPMNVCQLHGLNVPPGSSQERRAMIANELADELAEQPGDVEFDYWELSAPNAEERTSSFNVDVLAMAAPWIDQMTRDCRDARLDCWTVDGPPLAMARAVGVSARLGFGEIALAIDWGYSNVTICVVGDNRALYVRRLRDCGLRRILESISDSLGVTLDQAQHLVDTQGVSTAAGGASTDRELQAAITYAAADTIDKFVEQVQRTLQFLQGQRRHLSPKTVWLMGGGATVRNIQSYLARAIDMPVRIWAVPTSELELPCVQGLRAAVFGPAVALSALAWRAA